MLGSILFNKGTVIIDDASVDKFEEIMAERSYSIIYNELSRKEKEIIKCALINNSNQYILEKTGFSKSQLSNYKKVLNLKGIISNDRYSISFILPRFEEFFGDMVALEE